MLRALRNQTQSIFFKCFLVLLVCGFALWGVGDLTGGQKQRPVLLSENQEVTLEKVINELNRLRYTLAERPTLQETLQNGMLQNVLNKFEQEILLNSEAKSMKLHVPVSIHTKAIIEEKAFKDPLGKFSQNKFSQSLKNAGLSENKYIEMIKTEANYKQLSMPFLFNNIYNEKFIKDLIDWQNQIRDIEYEITNYINKNDVERPLDKVLEKFFLDNKNLYKLPVTRDIKYIEISPSIFENQVIINEKKLKERYETEKSNYITEEKREVYQITTQDVQKANSFKNHVSQGKKFESAAKEFFNLTTKDIAIGLINKFDLPEKSSKLVFDANLNEVIGPIKTEFGHSIYKIIKINPKEEISFEKATKDLKTNLIKEISTEILYENLDLIEDLLAEGNNLQEIIKSDIFKKDIPIKKLEKVSKNGLIYSYKDEKKILNKTKIFLNGIWSTELNQISDLITTNDDNYILIEVVSENKKHQPNFKTVKENVYKQWLANEIVVKTKAKLKKIILNNNQKLSSTLSIKRDDQFIDKIKDRNAVNKIFDINNKDVNFINTKNALIAVKILNKKVGNYKKNKTVNKNLNMSLSKSFFKDFSNFYIENLATKHKLIRNYNEIEKFLLDSEPVS